MVWQAILSFFKAVGAWAVANPITAVLTAYSTYTGVKGLDSKVLNLVM